MNELRVFQRRHAIGVFYISTIVLLSFACSAPAATEIQPKSLQALYDEANRLAETPEGREQAMARYHAIIEQHRANEKTYQAAMHRLANCYSESGQAEEGIRFFINLAQDIWNAERPQTAGAILNQFKLKNPEAVEKVVAELYPSSQGKPGVTAAVPSKQLAQAILQRNDASLREQALARLQEMLAENASDAEKREGLATLRSALTAKFDRRPFHLLVLPLLSSQDAQIRALALQCLPGLEADIEDLPLVVPMAGDESPQVRVKVAGALIQLGQGKKPQLVVPALMQLLRDEDTKVVEETIRSMWGQYSTPEFDALLIDLSREQRYHHNVIYFCLSTMRSKSPAVCHRLVEELAEPDWNNSGRAAWGLTYGVTEEAKALVEEGLLKALPEETNQGTRKSEFRALRNVATEKSRPYLASVAASEMETEEIRKTAHDILAALDRKQNE